MAIGDDALAEGMDVTPDETTDANTLGTEISKTRDYIAQFFNSVKAWVTATFVPKSDVYNGTGSVFNKIPRYDGSGRLIAASPTAANQAAPKAYVDSAVAGVSVTTNQLVQSGNTFGWVGGGWYTNDTLGIDNNLTVGAGHLFVPNSSAATSSFTVAYINGDGRLSRGSSSERYKKYISAIDPASLGNIFPEFHRFQMRADGIGPADDTWRYGYIAEHLIGTDAEPFAVTIDGQVESIDFIGLLLAQVAQLHKRVQELEAGGE